MTQVATPVFGQEPDEDGLTFVGYTSAGHIVCRSESGTEHVLQLGPGKLYIAPIGAPNPSSEQLEEPSV